MTGKLPDPEAQRPPPTPRHRVLAKHSSNLPNSLYVLSFAPPLPSLFRQPREFVLHPYALYAIGTFSACIAGVGLPAFDIIFGYWTNGVNSGLPSIINARGSEAGIIATCVGVVFVATFAIFLITCESLLQVEADSQSPWPASNYPTSFENNTSRLSYPKIRRSLIELALGKSLLARVGISTRSERA